MQRFQLRNHVFFALPEFCQFGFKVVDIEFVLHFLLVELLNIALNLFLELVLLTCRQLLLLLTLYLLKYHLLIFDSLFKIFYVGLDLVVTAIFILNYSLVSMELESVLLLVQLIDLIRYTLKPIEIILVLF